jgi:REP element-mobilizing transposase RayT
LKEDRPANQMTQTEATSRAARYSGRLKRLDASFYRGQSYVHWTFSIQGRKTGWLCPEHEADLLSAMRDWLVRYHLCCYAYCLMPDHGHFLLIGLNDRSDQQAFVREFTRSWNQLLGPLQLSRQAYDSVLREKDRRSGAFSDLGDYIWQNPVRAELVGKWQDWPHLGTVLPGYRSLDPRKPYFRDNFWKGYQDQAGV